LIIADLTLRRGQIQGQEMRGNASVIQAMVVLMNMFGYVTNLRSMSQGRATFTMQFDRYVPVPGPDDDPPFRPAIGIRP
jgi:elongation factor G